MYREILSAGGEKQFSHRNEVYMVEYCGKRYIRKRYLQKDVSQTEYETLMELRLARVAVPEVLYFNGEYIVLEYINGCTYEAVLERYEEGAMSDAEIIAAARAMTDWLFAYYAAFARKRGDINFRNFIWVGGRCAGVDFEEVTDCAPYEEDMGRMLTYAAMYKPACSKKKRVFCGLLLEQFVDHGASARLLKRYALEEVGAMCNRRQSFRQSAPAVRAFIYALFGDEC